MYIEIWWKYLLQNGHIDNPEETWKNINMNFREICCEDEMWMEWSQVSVILQVVALPVYIIYNLLQ
jgi:hypothetical protein